MSVAILVVMVVAVSPQAAACPNQLPPQKAVYQGGAAPKKLGELPPGRLYHAVLKESGACDVSEVRTAAGWVDFTTGPAHPPIQAATPPGR